MIGDQLSDYYFAKKAKIKYIDANKTKNLLNLSSFVK